VTTPIQPPGPHSRRIVAVIDVGSNSVRLLVARELSRDAFEVIDEERFDARLGEGGAQAPLTPAAFERGLAALRLVTEVAKSYGPARIIAVGTEALRRAPNAVDFIERVAADTGVRLRILSAHEEAYASYLGVMNSTGLRDGCLVDIGGGSLELMTIAGRQLDRALSVPLGALYARERYLPGDPPAPREVRALRKAVRQQLGNGWSAPLLLGAGGAVRNLARIVRLRRKYPLRRLHGLSLTRREVARLAANLAAAPADERRRMAGVGAARVDSLHAAAIVIDEVMALTGAESLVVSGQGLREGIVWQEMRGPEPLVADVRAASIGGLAQANGVDALAAEPVVSVAAALFAATAPVHRLKEPDLDLLLAATRLAGIGMHVDYYGRDRHAEYLVHSGDLHGFSHREIVLLGALVRCADSGSPDLAQYRGLVSAEDTHRVAVLAVLLGIARAVRRRLPSPVLGFDCSLERDTLCLEVRANVPLHAELIALDRQRRRLDAALKLALTTSVR
jgi:exopolyphosphatase / guanosine-5'-triphosphate,3'-diphosphate pyrophosphatase